MINILLLKKQFKKGDVVCEEGQVGSEAYIIRNGYLTISKMDGDKKIVLATRGPGEIVGEMALIDDCPRSATLTAKTDLTLELITRKNLKEMMEHLPEPVVLIIHQLLERLRDANEMAVMNAPEES